MSLSKFKTFLIEHKVENPQIELAMKLIAEFEEYLKSRGKGMEKTKYEDMQEFSSYLLQKKENTFENYIALLRYGYFTKNNYKAPPQYPVIRPFNTLSQKYSTMRAQELRQKCHNGCSPYLLGSAGVICFL